MGEAVFRGSQFTKRPDTGSVGDLSRVRANYFEVTKFQNMNISHYDVVISPTVPPRLNMKVFNRFVDQYRDRALGGARPVFDGKSNMFAHKLLPFEAHSFEVELEEDNAPMASRRPPRRFRIRIRKTRDIFLDDLFQFLEAKGDMTENCHMAIMAMDIIISHKVALRYPTVRRSFYTPRATKELPGGLEAWPGYYQSARPTRKGLMMININLTATAFYQRIPLVGLISKILAPYDIRRGLLGDNRHKVEDIIRKLKITDNHRAGNKRKFKIEGLTPTSASNTMFDRGDGSSIDVKTYFQNVYNKRLQYPYLPCVIVRRGVYLPIEICDVLPEQRYMRKLNKDQIEAMMDFARQNPNARANKIQEGLTILNYRGNEYLQQFGMSISNEMTEVNARILPTPTIKYHPSSREHDVQPKGGVWNLRDKRLATGMTLGSWSVLAFLDGNRWPDPVIYHFIREIVNTCEDTGMNIPNKRPPLLRANLQGNTEESLKQAWITAGNMAKSKPQLILCILPNMEINLYAEIKRVGDTIIGVATQCVQSVHMRQPKKQYCANVCLKVNVKLGGMNSCLDRGDIEFVDAEPTIVMGADVSHPPPGDREGRSSSFAALCASVDAKASRYAATIRAQEGRDEIIADLGNMVKELLKTFYQTCGSKPQRILFYRDGVSESQFVHVLRDEINAIRGACQALDVKYRPTITFVVVQKRHNTRFFPMERRYTDRSGNCLPGTVIDTDITHPFEFDFYLQSHAGLSSQSAGTSRPAHYHVLFDENGFHADSLQTLSYNLCYIYARCTRAVSLVPPVYYAHLVTARARLYSVADPTTYGVVKQELQKVMYFV